MRDETRRRLDRALLAHRLKWAAAATAVIAVVIGALYWKSLDVMVVATNIVDGTVVFVGPPPAKLSAAVVQWSAQVDVKLNDARVAHLLAPRETAPKLGAHVRIADQIHGSGRHTFAWR